MEQEQTKYFKLGQSIKFEIQYKATSFIQAATLLLFVL